MKGLCGWFSERPIGDGTALLRRMMAAGGGDAADATTQVEARAGLAASGQAARPKLVNCDGFLLAVAGHPRLTRETGRSEDLVEIAANLRLNGAAALPEIGGDFALAAWNPVTARGLLAIDRIGVHQLAYARLDGALSFASTLDALAAYPGVRRELSLQAVYDYLYFHVCPGPNTIYTDLLRVPPGHFVEFDRGVEPAPRAYWSMSFEEGLQEGMSSLRPRFLNLLECAVGDVAKDASCGAFLSGGTDSSTVSGMLCRTSGAPARTFSIGFDVPGYDEMDYARIAARHFGCDHHEYYVTPADVVSAIPKIAAFYDQPFGNASAIPAYYCAKFASEHGVDRLLAGDGGDELFGGNDRYAKQHIFGLYDRLPRGLRRTMIEPLVLSTPVFRSLPGLRKLSRYVEQARQAMPWRYESYNLLNYLGVENVLTPEFIGAIDREHPHQLLSEAHAPYVTCSLINQMLGIDLRFTLADGDLPKVTRMCELAGIDVTFPLLDDRLIDFSASLPPDMKLRGTRLRWFFKEALRDFLPPEVLSKRKHGFGLPVGAWLLDHKPLFNLAAESIHSLRPHGIVQSTFVDELLGPRLREHSKFFGTMVWILMMLGLWFDSRRH
jgi:asparagine synthase (glutamine-hydrolysing)